MLSIMRRQARSWMIKVILFAIVVVFVFWGVGGFDAPQDNHVAVVNDEPISFAAYRQSYDRLREQYRRAYGGALDEQMLRVLRLNEQALHQLIDRVVMLQEAKRLDIRITDNTLDQAILSIPAFQSNGVFDQERAGFILAQSRMTTAEFRNIYREDLMIEKLRALILEGVTVSEAEARQWYDWYHAEVNLHFIHFDRSRYTDIVPSDAQIAEHFDAHADNYRTEPKVKASYMRFDPSAYRDQTTITDDDVAQYYYERPHEFTTETTVDGSNEVQRRSLEDVADEIRAGLVDAEARRLARRKAEQIYDMTFDGDDLAVTAQTHQLPIHTTDFFTPQRLQLEGVDNARPFVDAAFRMRTMGISEPLEMDGSFFVLQVTERIESTIPPLEDVRERVRADVTIMLQDERARADAEASLAALRQGQDPAEVAAAYGLEPAETGFFKRTAAVPQIGYEPDIVQAAFGLQPERPLPEEVFNARQGWYVLKLNERKSPDAEGFAAEKADIMRRLPEQKKQDVFQQWLADLKARSRIHIEQQMIQ